MTLVRCRGAMRLLPCRWCLAIVFGSVLLPLRNFLSKKKSRKTFPQGLKPIADGRLMSEPFEAQDELKLRTPKIAMARLTRRYEPRIEAKDMVMTTKRWDDCRGSGGGGGVAGLDLDGTGFERG